MCVKVQNTKIRNILEIIDGDRGKNYPKKSDFYKPGFCLFMNAKNVKIDGLEFETIMFINEKKDKELRLDNDFELVKWNAPQFINVSSNIPDASTAGVTKVDLGLYRYIGSDSISGYDTYTVLVRVIMDPDRTTWSCGLFGWVTCDARSESEYLKVYSDLAYYTSGNENILDSSAPETKISNETYTIGLGGSVDSEGKSSFSISASTTFTVDRLDVRGTSKYSEPFRAETIFDYKSKFNLLGNHLWDAYLEDSSTQRMGFLVLNPESKTWFSSEVFVLTRFEQWVKDYGIPFELTKHYYISHT